MRSEFSFVDRFEKGKSALKGISFSAFVKIIGV